MKNENFLFAILIAALASAAPRATAQQVNYSEYQWIFHGMEYETNAAGNIVGTPITDQTLLADRAAEGGITDLSTVAIVYHIGGAAPNGGNPPWDTIDIINATNGAFLTTEFGLYYGSDGQYDRTAVTNATSTEERRIDYLYTFNNSGYTINASDSIGAAIITKRFLNDGSGNTNTIIDGSFAWDALPHGTNIVPIVCTGTFTLGKPLF
ncbi:MAG TPA: hypothetical protein VH595_19025 [Verrucomicrobiae bacterium]|jgi:hypothetical protein|nr:hypothetical protein [Verrucomicrobiae bacterium]